MWVVDNSPNSSICHYGVKGMKWGVTHEQKTSTSITSRIKDKYESKKKSNDESRIKKYENLGYTKEQSKILSEGERKTKKALMIAGGVVLTAAVAYGAYKYRDYAKDSLVKAEQMMQTVHKEDVSERLKDGNPFYATFTKKDNTIYASPVFSHFKEGSQVTQFYTKDGIKIASHKSGEKEFKDLFSKNEEFRDYVKKSLNLKDDSDYESNFVKKMIYKKFNHKLVYRTGGPDGLDHDRFHNMFYDALKSKGYGGVIDVNDSTIEGFTYKPTIVFSDATKHVVSSMKATEEDLGASRLAKGLAYSSTRKILTKPLKSTVVQYSAAIGASSTISYLINVDKITNYKVENPKTKLSDKQILELVS